MRDILNLPRVQFFLRSFPPPESTIFALSRVARESKSRLTGSTGRQVRPIIDAEQKVIDVRHSIDRVVDASSICYISSSIESRSTNGRTDWTARRSLRYRCDPLSGLPDIWTGDIVECDGPKANGMTHSHNLFILHYQTFILILNFAPRNLWFYFSQNRFVGVKDNYIKTLRFFQHQQLCVLVKGHTCYKYIESPTIITQPRF